MHTLNLSVNGRQDQRAYVDRWAQLIESSGLCSLAFAILDVVDALGFLGQQALLVIEPLVREVSSREMDQAEHLLGNSDVRAQLRARLIRGRGSDE